MLSRVLEARRSSSQNLGATLPRLNLAVLQRAAASCRQNGQAIDLCQHAMDNIVCGGGSAILSRNHGRKAVFSAGERQTTRISRSPCLPRLLRGCRCVRIKHCMPHTRPTQYGSAGGAIASSLCCTAICQSDRAISSTSVRYSPIIAETERLL